MSQIRDNSILSPFSKHQILERNVKFNSVFHYYVYKKFIDTEPGWARKTLQLPKTKLIVASKSKRYKIATNWDGIKYKTMKNAYMLKHKYHPDFVKCLSRTDKFSCTIALHDYWSPNGDNMIDKLNVGQKFIIT